MLAEIIINPIGDFPLNDDWAYARSVYDYLNSGEIKFSFWQACPDLPQFFTGLLVSKLFGFSFTALRFISISCVLLMIPVLNSIIKLMKIETKWNLLILSVFVFNPLTIVLSNTFMSDIFQLLLLLILLQLILLYFKEEKKMHFVLFVLVSVIATLNRQIGMVMPLLFGIILLYVKGRNIKNIAFAIIPVALSYLSVLIYENITRNHGIIPVNYNLQINNIIHTLSHPDLKGLAAIVYYFTASTICLGLFMMPLTVSNTKTHFSEIKKSVKTKLVLLIYLTLVVAKLFFSGHMLPFVGNIFHQSGFGPIIMTGYNTDDPLPLSTLASVLSIVFNLAGAISFFLAGLSIVQKLKTDKKNLSGFLLILLFVFYLLPLCFSYANDRYLLVIVPFFILAYVSSFGMQFEKLKFAFCFGAMLFLALAGTHDYMSFHKAKYKATNHLLNDLKITPNEIDGGFEFNGWHLGDPLKNYNPEHKGRWWWVDKDNYIVTPVLLENYSVESEYKVNTLLLGVDKIYVLKKN